MGQSLVLDNNHFSTKLKIWVIAVRGVLENNSCLVTRFQQKQPKLKTDRAWRVAFGVQIKHLRPKIESEIRRGKANSPVRWIISKQKRRAILIKPFDYDHFWITENIIYGGTSLKKKRIRFEECPKMHALQLITETISLKNRFFEQWEELLPKCSKIMKVRFQKPCAIRSTRHICLKKQKFFATIAICGFASKKNMHGKFEGKKYFFLKLLHKTYFWKLSAFLKIREDWKPSVIILVAQTTQEALSLKKFGKETTKLRYFTFSPDKKI